FIHKSSDAVGKSTGIISPSFSHHLSFPEFSGRKERLSIDPSRNQYLFKELQPKVGLKSPDPGISL
ncbi:hypothetical protein N9Z23_03565, partial [Akkermansiaceae bacterium]|nr:hypothetical protein [Akkermansiaceae bacterium]